MVEGDGILLLHQFDKFIVVAGADHPGVFGFSYRSGVLPSLGCFLDDLDFFGCEFVEFVDKLVDLLVGSVDLALIEFLVGGDGGGGEFLVEVE